MLYKLSLSLLFCLLALTGCDCPALQTPIAPIITPISSPPPVNRVLPQAVYLISGGQIWRIAADGHTLHQISHSSSPVLDLAVGPHGDWLAYIQNNVLWRATGQGESQSLWRVGYRSKCVVQYKHTKARPRCTVCSGVLTAQLLPIRKTLCTWRLPTVVSHSTSRQLYAAHCRYRLSFGSHERWLGPAIANNYSYRSTPIPKWHLRFINAPPTNCLSCPIQKAGQM